MKFLISVLYLVLIFYIFLSATFAIIYLDRLIIEKLNITTFQYEMAIEGIVFLVAVSSTTYLAGKYIDGLKRNL